MEETIALVIASGTRVPLGMKVKIRHAFQIMRRAADLPPSSITTQAMSSSSLHTSQDTSATPPFPPTQPIFQIMAQNVELEPGQLASTDLVAFSETVHQSSDVKVKRLTPKDD